MRITKVETIRHPAFPRFTWLHVHTADGHIGLGEVGHFSTAAEAIIHDLAPRFLIGEDATRIDHLWTKIHDHLAIFTMGGSEMRALGAIDVALWDLAGKRHGVPIYELLGGASRDTIPVYNTCIGSDPIPDNRRFLEDAGSLAAELVDEGFRCMKIWPFDAFAAQSHGQLLSNSDLDAGLAPVRAIRDRVGDSIGIAIELHGFWNLPCALRIADALQPYRVQWIEEALSPESLGAQVAFAKACHAPVVSGERLVTRFAFRGLLEAGGATIVNPDLTWTGGLGELKRIATMAEAFRIPVKPHNEGGPVHHLAAMHVAANVPSLYLLEMIRHNTRHLFPQIVDELPPLVRVPGPDGRAEARLALPSGPGLGISLSRRIIDDPLATRKLTD